ncbi:unnamed protein product [Prunus armeniaca]
MGIETTLYPKDIIFLNYSLTSHLLFGYLYIHRIDLLTLSREHVRVERLNIFIFNGITRNDPTLAVKITQLKGLADRPSEVLLSTVLLRLVAGPLRLARDLAIKKGLGRAFGARPSAGAAWCDLEELGAWCCAASSWPFSARLPIGNHRGHFYRRLRCRSVGVRVLEFLRTSLVEFELVSPRCGLSISVDWWQILVSMHSPIKARRDGLFSKIEFGGSAPFTMQRGSHIWVDRWLLHAKPCKARCQRHRSRWIMMGCRRHRTRPMMTEVLKASLAPNCGMVPNVTQSLHVARLCSRARGAEGNTKLACRRTMQLGTMVLKATQGVARHGGAEYNTKFVCRKAMWLVMMVPKATQGVARHGGAEYNTKFACRKAMWLGTMVPKATQGVARHGGAECNTKLACCKALWPGAWVPKASLAPVDGWVPKASHKLYDEDCMGAEGH